MEDVMVSVICKTYNHEKYIKRALNGFVNQKTNYKYEVIVHDDASTDRTAEIIKEYEKKYPQIIKPIYQKENQYSKGLSFFIDFIRPKVHGKYVAICEGDDYWCDMNKIQKQVDFLENHPEFICCVHNTVIDDMYINKKYVKYGHESKELKLKDCVLCGGQSFHTSSLMVKRNFYLSRPDFAKLSKEVGDYPCAIYYSLSGKIYYMKDVMSVYRMGTENSWTKRIADDRKRMAKSRREVIEMLKGADAFSGKKHHDLFMEAIEYQTYEINKCNLDYYKMVRCKKWFKTEPVDVRVKFTLYAYFPFLVKIKNIYHDKIKDRKK